MIVFWVAAALLSAAAAVLIVLRAARAADRREPEDPSIAVYRRQLAEIDDLATRGLLLEGEHRSARTEAARRLLRAADAQQPTASTGARSRMMIIALAAATPLIALVIYLLVGSPQLPDQPFAQRLKSWTANPSKLGPAEVAAVWRSLIAQHPNDPVPLVNLAYAEVDSGDPASAEQDLRKALLLDPKNAQIWQLLGVTIAVQAPEGVSSEALAAFKHAVDLDPHLPSARYALGREQITGGDVQDGLATWKALSNDLPASDRSRADLLAQIAVVEKNGALPAVQPGQGAADQQSLIRAMVARLAAKLQAQPDDPQGWGRLIRSYAVLGDEADRAAAIARAQNQFKNRPDAWRAVESAETAPQ